MNIYSGSNGWEITQIWRRVAILLGPKVFNQNGPNPQYVTVTDNKGLSCFFFKSGTTIEFSSFNMKSSTFSLKFDGRHAALTCFLLSLKALLAGLGLFILLNLRRRSALFFPSRWNVTQMYFVNTHLIYRCNSNAILQTSSAGLPIWQRFRGLTPGPLLSQIPPQLSKTVARL